MPASITPSPLPENRNAPHEDGGRFCLHCQKPIAHKSKKALFCSDTCKEKARTKSRPFIGLDGEGIGNRYILLAAKKRGWTAKHVLNRDGLSTKDCLDFLLHLPKGSFAGTRPIYVWFAFDYDINMILGDLPLKGETASIEQLRRTNETIWEGYKITYIPRKIFKLKKDGRYFSSTDTWGFFQSTFEAALEDWGIETPEIITRGKKARQDFSTWKDEDIIAYNEAELNGLSEVMEELRNSVRPLNLPVRSWHGPGALAGAFLSKNKVAHRLAEIPDELYEVATRAYFGGRIDAAGFGTVEPVYHYDIVSAYPAAIRYLPDLTRLNWAFAKGRPPLAGVYVARISWEIPRTRWGAFPWRSRNGSIRFPQAGEGWYWGVEIEGALARFDEDCFRWHECWYASHEEITHPFYNVVAEAFEYRHELKKQGLPSHKAVKLVLNSLYGKFAQTVGKAQYYSPVWAGLITAYTRATINRAITPDVVCTMTDSLWSAKPLDIPTTNLLGEWEEQEEAKLILAEAGLYQATKPDGSRFLWQRGFDKRMPVDIPTIVQHWLKDDPAYEARYTVNRFIGMGLASVTSYPWREWIDIDRKISPVPFVGTSKRLPLYPLDSDEKRSRRFQPLRLRPVDEQVCSYPYSKLTLDHALTVTRLEDEAVE